MYSKSSGMWVPAFVFSTPTVVDRPVFFLRDQTSVRYVGVYLGRLEQFDFEGNPSVFLSEQMGFDRN